jgi:small subunit ribosomal protein S18
MAEKKAASTASKKTSKKASKKTASQATPSKKKKAVDLSKYMTKSQAGYELMVLVPQELAKDSVNALGAKIEKMVKKFNGEMVYYLERGYRTLAFPVNDRSRANFLYYVYQADPDVVSEIETNLKYDDNVMKFITVQLDRPFDKEAFLKTTKKSDAGSKASEDETEDKDKQEKRKFMGGGRSRRRAGEYSYSDQPFTDNNYKNAEFLRNFVSEHGKITPRRISKVSAQFQRRLTREIKRARQIALVGYTTRGGETTAQQKRRMSRAQ